MKTFLDRGYNVVANSRNITKSGVFEASDELALVDGNPGQVVASGDGGSSDALEDAWTGTVTYTIVQ